MFSWALLILGEFDIEISEYVVDDTLFRCLDEGSLTEKDLAKIDSTKRSSPGRIYDYILEEHLDERRKGTLWTKFPPVLPFAIIDQRLMYLAISFWDAPGDRIATAYRKLEDRVRKRIDSDQHGRKLFSEVFFGESSKAWLAWNSGG